MRKNNGYADWKERVVDSCTFLVDELERETENFKEILGVQNVDDLVNNPDNKYDDINWLSVALNNIDLLQEMVESLVDYDKAQEVFGYSVKGRFQDVTLEMIDMIGYIEEELMFVYPVQERNNEIFENVEVIKDALDNAVDVDHIGQDEDEDED